MLIIVSIFALQIESKMERVSPKTKFVDFNLDVLFLIFDNLEFAELLNIAQTNSKLHPVGAEVFSHKYGDYEIQMLTATNQYRGEEMCEISDEKKFIKIFDYRTILRVLKYFGIVIKKAHTNNNEMRDDRSREINKMLNQHAIASLTHLDLHYIKSDTLKQFSIPFEQVEDLTIKFGIELKKNKLTGNIKSFNQLFPNLKRLTIGFFVDVDYTFIDYKLQNLEYLDIETARQACGEGTYQLIKSFLLKNPGIRSIELKYFPDDMLIFIHEHFKYLESLTVKKKNLPF